MIKCRQDSSNRDSEYIGADALKTVKVSEKCPPKGSTTEFNGKIDRFVKPFS